MIGRVIIVGTLLASGCATVDHIVDPEFPIAYQVVGPNYADRVLLLYIDPEERLELLLTREYLNYGFNGGDNYEICDAGVQCFRLGNWDAPAVIFDSGSDAMEFDGWSYSVSRSYDHSACEDYEAHKAGSDRRVAYRYCPSLGILHYGIFDATRMISRHELRSYRGLGSEPRRKSPSERMASATAVGPSTPPRNP